MYISYRASCIATSHLTFWLIFTEIKVLALLNLWWMCPASMQRNLNAFYVPCLIGVTVCQAYVFT